MNKLLILSLLFGAFAVASASNSKAFDTDVSQQLRDIVDAYRDNNDALAATRPISGTARDNDPTDVIISGNGYPAETYTVTTEDCYILQLHRIPYGKNSPPQDGVVRPVVYLQHGLIMSSADWVIPYPEKGLGYILADAGYDVWLGNYRGNTYSRDHCDLDPDDDNEFWYFTWDQHGRYDIPAMIDTILLYTGQEKLHYVGHSMGTTGFMVMAQERPEYMDKVIMVNMLAPVAYMEHMESPIRYLAPFTEAIEYVVNLFGIGEFLPSSLFMDIIADLFCDPILFPPLVCESVIFLICGYDPNQMNESLLEDIAMHTPAGTSTYTILHYAQEVSGGFHKYDMGSDNINIYGTDFAPVYYPQNVTLPVSLYWSQNDWLAAAADVASLTAELPNIYDNYEVPYESWNHMDYLFGIDADTLVYQQLMDNMARAEAEFQASKKLKK